MTLTIDIQFPLRVISVSEKLPPSLRNKIIPYAITYVKRSGRRQTISVDEKTILKQLILNERIFPKSVIGIKFKFSRKESQKVQVCFDMRCWN